MFHIHLRRTCNLLLGTVFCIYPLQQVCFLCCSSFIFLYLFFCLVVLSTIERKILDSIIVEQSILPLTVNFCFMHFDGLWLGEQILIVVPSYYFIELFINYNVLLCPLKTFF